MNQRLCTSVLGISVTMLAAACGGSQSSAPTTPTTTSVTTPSASLKVAAQKVSDTPEPADTDGKIKWAIAGAQRTDKEKARDQYRHPLETLEFFGLKDDMTVVELWPGGGWYTEILAPVLHDKGKLVVTTFDISKGGEAAENEKAYDAKLAGAPAIYGNVQKQQIAPPENLVLGPDGSADMVLTFRNYHGWIGGKYADKVIAAAFKVLKPGGVLGIEEHRANAGDTKNKPSDTGYVEEAFIIEAVQMQGFKLDSKSEINANPKDTKDYAKGVWALPPSYRNGETDKAKYEAIGESDRMTLKFVKPAK
ncbi:MAG TPA: methyltransferase domain-containing protein [Polyangiaceae bacterium]